MDDPTNKIIKYLKRTAGNRDSPTRKIFYTFKTNSRKIRIALQPDFKQPHSVRCGH
jgi:hypothetical protein